MNILDAALGGEAPSEPVVSTEAEQSGGPARGADGKFVSAEPAPVADAPVPVAETPREAGHVPIAALMDERDKRKASDERIAALEAQLKQRDPAGEPAYIDPEVEQRLLSERLNVSEDLARDKYGDDLVEAAKQAAIAKIAQSPAFQQEVFAQRNPYKFVVEWHKRETAMAKIADPTEIDDYLAWKAAKAADPSAQAPPAAAPAALPTPVTPPPRSLASTPSAGGVQTVPSGPGVAFENAIK